MKISRLFIRLLTFICLVISSHTLNAQLNATTIGDAVDIGGNCFIITPDELWQSGGVWYNNPIDFDEDFTIYYQNNFGINDANGADGMALVFKTTQNPIIGGEGGGVGYEGINESLIVEFDTFTNPENGDLPSDHISIMRNGVPNHNASNNLAGPIQASVISPNIEDGADHEIKIQWNATAQIFDVYFDCVLRLSLNLDIEANIFNGDETVYFGFVGSTGGFSNLHQVCFNSITFVENLLFEDQTICVGDNYDIDATVPSGVSYSWSPIAGVSDPNIANPTLAPTVTTTYTVTISDTCGETTTEQVTITVEPIDTPVFDAIPTICQGDMLAPLPTTSNNGITGAWSPIINNQATTTYTFTPDNQCSPEVTLEVVVNPTDDSEFSIQATCDGALISSLNQPGGTFSFNPVPTDGAVIDATTGTVTNGIPDTTYTVRYTTNGICPSFGELSFTVFPEEDPSFELIPTCDGATVNILGDAGGTFAFDVDPMDGAVIDVNSGTVTNAVSGSSYSVSYTTNIGFCPETEVNTFTVEITNDPGFTMLATCDGGVVDTFVTAGGVYSFNPLPVDGALIDAATGTVTNASPSATYTIEYTFDGPCPSSSLVDLTVLDEDDSTFSIVPTCEGGFVDMVVTPGGI
ncbi:MAG: hypothetical protein HRU50_14250, partial [Winogradskyella sp.]|uniref:L-type lectin-domain containing protein n=1 Tax=Winogradskyella sp. TaxID=1883156 RepID=UPI0025CCE807